MHVHALILDLGLILSVGGLTALIFRRFHQPIVLAYLLAGILVGHHVPLIPNVVDRAGIEVWAELGVIFLLFLLGIGFSFRKLIEVGRVSLTASAVEVPVMTALGWGAGKLLGWGTMDSLFLGGIVAISSTTIITKAFQELGVRTQHFARVVFGILVFEDLYAVLFLVLLSTLALTREFQGIPLLSRTAYLGVFLAAAILFGKFVFPRLLRSLRPHLNDELRVILSLTLCFAFVYASTRAGFSSALGAFLAGAILGDTSEGERIERFLLPIRDLFAAVFFTSVGMLFDVSILLEHPGMILFVCALIVLGKVIAVTIGMRIAGETRRVSLQAGLSLAQIGEFSFIIGMLGLQLGAIRPELYPTAVAVSLITTLTTPHLIRLALRLHDTRVTRHAVTPPKFWDSHLAELEIHPHSKLVGANLFESRLRETFGVTVLSIQRGERRIIPPPADERLASYDRLIVFGTDEQLLEVEHHLQTERHAAGEPSAPLTLEQIRLTKGSPLADRTVREAGKGLLSGGLILGVERSGARILTPPPSEVLRAGDLLWVYGPRDLLARLSTEGQPS